eukprot:442264_1
MIALIVLSLGLCSATAPNAVDCQVGHWAALSSCSAPCGGGSQTQTRSVAQLPSNGGAPCPEVVQTKPCNTHPCPVDCQVSGWRAFSECSKQCGGGEQEFVRQIIVSAATGGAMCPALVESRPCNTQPCSTTPNAVACQVSAWVALSSCSAPCGGGSQTQTRRVIQSPANGGAPCPAVMQTQPCNTHPCPVDCQVSGWRAFSECSKQCGGGEQVRTRQIIVSAATGGAPCPALIESQVCNVDPCEKCDDSYDARNDTANCPTFAGRGLCNG